MAAGSTTMLMLLAMLRDRVGEEMRKERLGAGVMRRGAGGGGGGCIMQSQILHLTSMPHVLWEIFGRGWGRRGGRGGGGEGTR